MPLCTHDHHTQDLRINATFKQDPTRTTTLRQRFMGEAGRRFRKLKGRIREVIVEEDGFGLTGPTVNRQFDFPRDATKVEAFMEWLRQAQRDEILEVRQGVPLERAAQQAWTATYVRAAYKKGVTSAAQQMRGQGVEVSDRWIDAAFNRPIHADRVGLIYTRAYSQLEGITEAMDQQISRELAQGLAEGKNPLEIARRLNNRVDKVGRTRARTLARTEVISAHADATLNSYQEAGVEGVEVEAEWSTAGDSRVCFPAYTEVDTAAGSKRIEDVCIGDYVATPLGFRAVRDRGQRPYQGSMTALHFPGGGHLFCTSDHPLWSEDRMDWIAAEDLNINERCKTASDKTRNIIGIVNLHLTNSHNMPAVTANGLVSASVLDRIMPIDPINLDSNGRIGESKVYRVVSDGVLLDITDSKFFEGEPYFTLNGRFATEGPIAREAAEPSIRGAGYASEVISAVLARDNEGRASAFFGAIQPVKAARLIRSSVNKLGAASFAGFVDPAFSLNFAGDRAVVVPMCNAGFNGKVIAAPRAQLSDRRGVATGIVTGARAEPPSTIGGPEPRSACLAVNFRDKPSAFGVALMRAVKAAGAWVHSIASLECLAAPIAGIARKRPLPGFGKAEVATEFSFRGSGFELLAAMVAGNDRHVSPDVVNSVVNYTKGTLTVHDISVEEARCFYASGVLVHNCDLCRPMEGQVFQLEEARGMIPRHPNCRCTYIPVVKDPEGVALT